MSTNEKVSTVPARATDTAVAGATATDVTDEEFLEEEYTPGEADGGMFGAVPAKKAQHFWPSAKRLMGLLKPERAGIIAVLAMVTVAVVLNVIAPRILGQAMDVIFAGVVGKQLPAGATKEQFIEGLRSQGQDNFADMLAKMDVVPGAGSRFPTARVPHQRGPGDVLRRQHLLVAAGLRPEYPGHAGGPHAAR